MYVLREAAGNAKPQRAGETQTMTAIPLLETNSQIGNGALLFPMPYGAAG